MPNHLQDQFAEVNKKHIISENLEIEEGNVDSLLEELKPKSKLS